MEIENQIQETEVHLNFLTDESERIKRLTVLYIHNIS